MILQKIMVLQIIMMVPFMNPLALQMDRIYQKIKFYKKVFQSNHFNEFTAYGMLHTVFSIQKTNIELKRSKEMGFI